MQEKIKNVSSNGKDLENMYYHNLLNLDTISLEDLNILIDYLSEEDLNRTQMDLLTKCLDRLSLFEDYSFNDDNKQSIWDNVLLKEFEQEKPTQITQLSTSKISVRKRIAIFIAVAVISMLGVGTIVSSAKGVNPFTYFFNTDDSSIEGEIVTRKDYTDYDQFIKEYPEVKIPTYIPSGYTFDSASADFLDGRTVYNLAFYNGINYTTISQTIIIDGSINQLNTTFEANKDGVTQCNINGIDCYIIENINKTSIVWNTNDTQYVIRTFESIDELKLMFQSIS